MRALLLPLTFAASLLISVSSYAQVPSGATGLCKDGTYYSGSTKKGACNGHQGVKEWYGTAKATTSSPATAPAVPASTGAPATTVAPSSSAKSTANTSAATAAGGGPGQVWVNKSSKVYHCSGSKWYGKTKQGEYMTEAAAKAAGNRPDHGKACS
jgi:hypothetical protein